MKSYKKVEISDLVIMKMKNVWFRKHASGEILELTDSDLERGIEIFSEWDELDTRSFSFEVDSSDSRGGGFDFKPDPWV